MDDLILTRERLPDEFHELRGSEPDQLDSEVLKRLIEEVRVEETYETNSYNRYHNRHNRSR